MDAQQYIACKGVWKDDRDLQESLESENAQDCPFREKCLHYGLRQVPMICFYPVVPLKVEREKDGYGDCPEFIMSPFYKEKNFSENTGRVPGVS